MAKKPKPKLGHPTEPPHRIPEDCIHTLAEDLIELADHIEAAGLDTYATGRIGVLMNDQVGALLSIVRYAGPCKALPPTTRIRLGGPTIEPPVRTACLVPVEGIDDHPAHEQKLIGILQAIQKSMGETHSGAFNKTEVAIDFRNQARQLQSLSSAGNRSDQRWTMEEWQELLKAIRAVAAAADAPGHNPDAVRLTGRIHWALMDLYGGIRFEPIGEGRARERELSDPQRIVATQIITATKLIDGVCNHNVPVGYGKQLRDAVDEIEKAFGDLVAWGLLDGGKSNAQTEQESGQGATSVDLDDTARLADNWKEWAKAFKDSYPHKRATVKLFCEAHNVNLDQERQISAEEVKLAVEAIRQRRVREQQRK